MDRRRGDSRALARLAALLWLGCGALVLVVPPLLPRNEGASPAGLVAVGAVALVVGTFVWFAPWQRWRPEATLGLIPVACAVIAGFNEASRNPWLASLFFIVSFVWVGLAHPPGTCVWSTPVLVVAYFAPPFVRADEAGVAAALFVLPVTVLLGEAAAWVATRLDAAESERQRETDRFSALVRHASEFVIVLRDGVITYASPGVTRVAGYSPEDTIGRLAFEFVHPDDFALLDTWFVQAQGSGDVPVAYRIRHAEGTWRWIEGTLSDLRSDPAVAGVVINGHDVSERIAAVAKLEDLALRDQLTGLPNRTAFTDALEHLAADAALRRVAVGLLYIDLDGFKVVNDSLGHAAGDDLLSRLAQRLREATPSDHFLGRLGGDEFVVLVPTDGCATALDLAEQVASAIRAPIMLRGRRLVVDCSIGVDVRIPEQPQSLLRHADLALYRAKELGRGRCVVFDETLARRARRRLDTEAELRVAIEQSQLVCHYQPEIDLTTGRLIGVEALVRWEHPVRGLLAPGEFIDVAEESGLVVDLGRVVLRQATEMVVRWRQLDPSFFVACNVSPRQLLEPSLVDDVRSVLSTFGVPASGLRLEVVETALVEPAARLRLSELRALGVGLAIDDFGTGYSSLSYLDRLEVDVLKIDQTFLEPVRTGDERLAVVEATLAMASSLGLHTVAEGVETPAQVALLRRLGCPSAQGYFFGKPVTGPEITRLLVTPVGATSVTV